MKKTIMIVAMAAFAFSFSEANAQKVIKDASGKVFIDVQDMPAETFSTTTQNVIVTTSIAQGNKVFKKFQIATQDMESMNWPAAVGLDQKYATEGGFNGLTQGSIDPKTGCSTYSVDGNEGSWRVPNQKEMQLIWVMKDMLVTAGVAKFDIVEYWTAFPSWQVRFLDGETNDKLRSALFKVRCVREVN